MRSGRVMVSEWLAPLCSVSGAQTQTSSVKTRASLTSSLRPGDSMPSSFETRMRARRRSSGKSNATGDDLDSAHVGLERVGQRDRAVGPLIVFHHRDQRAADREAGAVERVDEACSLSAFGLESRVHAALLVIAAIRT